MKKKEKETAIHSEQGWSEQKEWDLQHSWKLHQSFSIKETHESEDISFGIALNEKISCECLLAEQPTFDTNEKTYVRCGFFYFNFKKRNQNPAIKQTLDVKIIQFEMFGTKVKTKNRLNVGVDDILLLFYNPVDGVIRFKS